MSNNPSSSALEELTAAIVKAVPELRCPNTAPYCNEHHETKGRSIPMAKSKNGITWKCPERGCSNSVETYISGDITLEDVLRACDDSLLCVYARGWFFLHDKATDAQWYLGKPLSNQSPETISFLHQLLCPTK